MKNVCIYFKLECSFLLFFYLVKQLGRKAQTDKRIVLTNTMVQSATYERWIGVGILYICDDKETILLTFVQYLVLYSPIPMLLYEILDYKSL